MCLPNQVISTKTTPALTFKKILGGNTAYSLSWQAGNKCVSDDC